MTCPKAGTAEYAAYYAKQSAKRSDARPCPVCGRLTRWRRPRRASLDLSRDTVCSVACVELARQKKAQEQKHARPT